MVDFSITHNPSTEDNFSGSHGSRVALIMQLSGSHQTVVIKSAEISWQSSHCHLCLLMRLNPFPSCL